MYLNVTDLIHRKRKLQLPPPAASDFKTVIDKKKEVGGIPAKAIMHYVWALPK
jgi:hypothetical protein